MNGNNSLESLEPYSIKMLPQLSYNILGVTRLPQNKWIIKNYGWTGVIFQSIIGK